MLADGAPGKWLWCTKDAVVTQAKRVYEKLAVERMNAKRAGMRKKRSETKEGEE
jgi:hypothetical protein